MHKNLFQFLIKNKQPRAIWRSNVIAKGGSHWEQSQRTQLGPNLNWIIWAFELGFFLPKDSTAPKAGDSVEHEGEDGEKPGLAKRLLRCNLSCSSYYPEEKGFLPRNKGPKIANVMFVWKVLYHHFRPRNRIQHLSTSYRCQPSQLP